MLNDMNTIATVQANRLESIHDRLHSTMVAIAGPPAEVERSTKVVEKPMGPIVRGHLLDMQRTQTQMNDALRDIEALVTKLEDFLGVEPLPEDARPSLAF